MPAAVLGLLFHSTIKTYLFNPLTVAWAREHHRPPDQWTVPAAVGAVLKAADDD